MAHEDLALTGVDEPADRLVDLAYRPSPALDRLHAARLRALTRRRPAPFGRAGYGTSHTATARAPASRAL